MKTRSNDFDFIEQTFYFPHFCNISGACVTTLLIASKPCNWGRVNKVGCGCGVARAFDVCALKCLMRHNFCGLSAVNCVKRVKCSTARRLSQRRTAAVAAATAKALTKSSIRLVASNKLIYSPRVRYSLMGISVCMCLPLNSVLTRWGWWANLSHFMFMKFVKNAI